MTEEKRYGAVSDDCGGFSFIGWTLSELAEKSAPTSFNQILAVELIEAKQRIKDLESKCSSEGEKALKESLESAWGLAMKRARQERDLVEVELTDLKAFREQDLQDAYEAGLMQREGPDELSEEHTAAWYRIEDRQHKNAIGDQDLDNDIRILMHALTILRDRLAVRSEKLRQQESKWKLPNEAEGEGPEPDPNVQSKSIRGAL